VLGVFVYHSLQPFSDHGWHVTNDRPSQVVEALLSFVDPWGIAFFFLIAGASAFLALGWRTPRRYLAERVMRLLVPLVVAYLVLCPVMAFIEARHAGEYTGSFVAGVPLFFEDVASNLRSTVFHPLLVPRTYHLWFVVFLLWFALLGLPVFVWLRGAGGRRVSAWLRERARRRGSTLLLAVPISVAPLAILPLWPEAEDWGSFAYLFGFFVAGGVLLSDPRLTAAVRRDVLPALGTAVAAAAAILLTGVPDLIEAFEDDPSYSWAYVWSYFAVTVMAWSLVQFLLGWGLRATSFERPLPPLVAAAAMPFFIVHQPVVMAVAYVVVRWDAPVIVEWTVIASVSFAVSAALAVGLARLPVVSTLFGVKRPAR
jgi:peptidoglycan/LPS O-acetylase OafA/YrhL